MSMIPARYRDWWDWDGLERPSRLMDQHFGLGLRREDLLDPLSLSFSAPSVRGGYLRPSWRELIRQHSGTSTVQADTNSFQVILDVQQFTPSEITVKTTGRTVVVEGKHNEKADEHGYISRHFVRKYLLPEDSEPDQVASTLSCDGVLTITAPKKAPPAAAGERVVPITATGPARPITVTGINEAPASPSPQPRVEEINIPVTQQ